MKPLSELTKEWRFERDRIESLWASQVEGEIGIYDKCIDALQAWLREVDSEEPPKWFKTALLDLSNSLWQTICRNLLGTTRTEGKK